MKLEMTTCALCDGHGDRLVNDKQIPCSACNGTGRAQRHSPVLPEIPPTSEIKIENASGGEAEPTPLPCPLIPCAHCWHQWGSSSGGMGSDGSSYASGTNRCCHCGELKKYDYNIPPRAPVTHGRYYADILRCPA